MQIDDGRGVVFSNDEEIVYFLQDKIQKFQEKIVEIDNYCQLLQLFKSEYDDFRQFQQEGRLNQFSPEQLEEIQMRLEQQRLYLYEIQLIDENCEVQ